MKWKESLLIGVIVAFFSVLALAQFTHDDNKETVLRRERATFDKQRMDIFKAGIACGAASTMQEVSEIVQSGHLENLNNINKQDVAARALEMAKHDYAGLIPEFGINQ